MTAPNAPIRDAAPAARLAPQPPRSPRLPRSFLTRSVAVIAYALAMGYVESAVVVYLRVALGTDPGSLGPLPHADTNVNFAAIEIGREAATLVMLVAVGWIAGRTALERLAWVAVAFGVWDISYYGWLWLFVGWPSSATTWDVLFLIPVVWTAPVWAPCAVSAVLVTFGLAAARSSELGQRLHVSIAQGAAAIGGGILVYVSFTLGSERVVADPAIRDYPSPVFAAGMALAIASGVSVLAAARSHAVTQARAEPAAEPR